MRELGRQLRLDPGSQGPTPARAFNYNYALPSALSYSCLFNRATEAAALESSDHLLLSHTYKHSFVSTALRNLVNSMQHRYCPSACQS